MNYPEYPFESHYLDRNGIRLHYLDEGCGKETMLMVHGNPTWSFLFRRLVTAFRNDFRIIVPDHIGCGLSDKPSDDRYNYRLRSRIDDLEALLEDRGIERDITLVVHDWGGPIGFGYAVRHPERIKRIIIFNSAAFGLPFGKSFPWPLWLFRNHPLGEWITRKTNAFARIAALICTVKPMPREIYQAYIAPYDTWENRIATIRFVQDVPLSPGDPSWNELQTIERGLSNFRHTPGLLCWGCRDFIFDRAFFREWRRRMPQLEIKLFKNAGHYILEDASQEVIDSMRDFLARNT